MESKRTLIVMCLQNDYVDIVYYGNKKINNIMQLINKIKRNFDQVIFIKDAYPNDHVIYKNSNIKYCVIDTHGANLNNELIVDNGDIILQINTLNLYTSDSGFYIAKTNDAICDSNLKNILDEAKIRQVYLCGINLEQQIFTTAYDAVTLGYECFVIEDLCCGKDDKKIEQSLKFLRNLGVSVIKNTDSIIKNKTNNKIDTDTTNTNINNNNNIN
jgi:nicotinamidase/pyrazinamidase